MVIIMKDIQKDILTVLILPVLLIGCLIIGVQLYYGLILGYVLTYIRARSKGKSPGEIIKVSFEGTSKVRNVLIMLTLIGALISTWMSMGTIPSLIYYGVEYLTKINIVVSAFLACLIMSMVLGTGVGTVSTIGMVYLGIAKGLGISLPLITGAIISGSYFGDRGSLMSSNANLVASVTGIKIKDSVAYMMKTGVLTAVISIVMFLIIGKNVGDTSALGQAIISLKDVLASSFTISSLALFTPLVLFVLVLAFKKTMVESILGTLVISYIIGIFSIEGYGISGLGYMLYGYFPEGVASEIISGGGILSMVKVLIIISVSTAICGIYDNTDMILPIIKPFRDKIKGLVSMYIFGGGLSIIISLTTCNQTLSSIIPGNYLRERCDEVGVSRLDFARIISDTGMISVPIIPWNVNAILVTSITGISAFDYFPFAVLCYGLPVVSLLYHIGKKNVKSSKLVKI